MEEEELSYDWMDITERGYAVLWQAATAAGLLSILNGYLTGGEVDFTVLWNAVVPVVAAGIAFGWNTLKGYRKIKKAKELNSGTDPN